MAILSWIVFGLVIGIIAKLLMPGKDPGGFIVTILLGIAGALVGGFIGRAMGFYGAGSERWVDRCPSLARSSCWRSTACWCGAGSERATQLT